MRALGVDLGRRRVGVAVSDTAGALATPHTTIVRDDASPDAWLDELVRLVDDLGVGTVVVGMPLSLDGRRTAAARQAQAAAESLRRALGDRPVTVDTVDERLTTVTAERSLAEAGRRGRERRQVVDRAAATVLLQAWLDRQRHRRVPAGEGGG